MPAISYELQTGELQAAWFRTCHAGSGHSVMLHHSVIAERRVALKFLDYALASGADSASKAKTEVDNTVTRTNEEVGLQLWLSKIAVYT